jgi:hypothetical protein
MTESDSGDDTPTPDARAFCNTPFPDTFEADQIEAHYHNLEVDSDSEQVEKRTKGTGDTDSLLILGTCQVFENVIDSASPDGAVYNFATVIKRTKTEKGGRPTLMFDRRFHVPEIAGK